MQLIDLISGLLVRFRDFFLNLFSVSIGDLQDLLILPVDIPVITPLWNGFVSFIKSILAALIPTDTPFIVALLVLCVSLSVIIPLINLLLGLFNK